MHSNRRRGYRAVPRQVRLALFIATLVLLAVLTILLTRCSSQDRSTTVMGPTPGPAADAFSETAQPEETPGAAEDEGEKGDDASADAPDEEVDVEADVAAQGNDAQPTGVKRKAVIRSFGDIIIHEPLFKTAYDSAEKTFDFSPYFSMIKDSLSKADYTVGNVDGPMGGKGSRGYRFYPQFNTPPHLLYALKDCGVDMLTLANNHALDTYFDGLKRQIDNVEKVGIDHIGAYRTQEEYDTPKVVDINGIKVGFTNYTVSTNNLEYSSDKEATIYGLRTTRNSSPTKDIAALRNAGAEFVVVYMHWGEEYERTVSGSQKDMARKLIAVGADMIIGGHPHVVQAIETVKAKGADGSTRSGLVVYSMGNFLSDQRARYRDSGIIFEFTLVDDGSGVVRATSPRYVPTYVWRVKKGDGYDYRVVACGETIENRPESMSDDVFKRVKQVWNELKALIGDKASIAKS
jgi:poly-gamma-glutamate capsule biosynthesis protein CapA/YwtB (metallophosphatase superfamily)